LDIKQSFSDSELEDIYRQAVSRYMTQRRSMVDAFVNEHYDLKGSTKLHRHSLGWDIAKTPVNAIASVLTVVKQTSALGLDKLGAKELSLLIADKNLFLSTKISKEIQWNVQTGLLELPCKNDGKMSQNDALLDEIFNDHRIQNQLTSALKILAPYANNEEVKRKLAELLTEYTGSRAAASDITVSLMTAATGLVTLHKLTPGIASLSNSVASGIVHSSAVHSFWAGSWAGGYYYSLFNVATPGMLTAGVFTSMLIPASFVATFAGIITDPLQRKLGLHTKKLNKVLDSTEVLLLGEDNAKLVLKDHYIARIFDLMDWTQIILRAARMTERDPKYLHCFSNILFNSNYITEYTPENLHQKHIQAAKSFPPVDRELKALWDGQRKIRIGYISADFNKHSVAYFLWPVVRHHNKDKFEIYCYYTGDVVDPVTHSFRQRSDRWLNCADINDQSLAELIRSHKLDILIDLSGHSQGNRLAVLSRRVAPVQINWLGYPHSTGIEAMDYRIVDETTDPVPFADNLSNEKLIRLKNSFLCYKGDAEVPYQKSPPHLGNGYITFGSFNNLAKVNDCVIESWAQILISVPSSRIIIKANQLTDKSNRSRIHAKFNELGVSTKRVELMTRVPDSIDHLSVYNRIDIALDTFPYNGTTTTCEALWMGVPTITFSGDRHASRVSASILKHAELDQFVADDLASYKNLAIALAENPEPLVALRPIMREQLNLSSLCNAEQFTANFETALSQLVTKSCGD